MTNRIGSDKRKMVQLYYFVLSCVISMFKFILINRSMLVWSGDETLEKLHCILAFKAQWCDHT